MSDQSEPDDYEPEEEIVVEEPQDISSYFNTPFNEERLQNVHRLRSTPYKDEAIYKLSLIGIYPKGRGNYSNFIENFLSERTILANYTSIEMALIDFDAAELVFKHSLYPTDLTKPGLFNLFSLVRSHFKTILTNAHGPDRERIINGRESMEQRHITKQDPIMVKPQQKRKNILGF